MRIVCFVIFVMLPFFAFTQKRATLHTISIPNLVLDTSQHSKIDTTLNGMVIKKGIWYEGYSHTDFEVGVKTTLGAYVKGVRQGRWLIYHDSMLFACLQYLDGYIEGNSTFYIVHDDFYTIQERDKRPSDSLYEDEFFYEAVRTKPLRLRYILQLSFVKGKAEGSANLLLPTGEKVMEWVSKENQISEILWLNIEKIDFELSETEIPFIEVWLNDIILKWIEYH
ncbi:MAG: hypothetical protein ACKVTZ_08875 [Bacteroidia bacterium]